MYSHDGLRDSLTNLAAPPFLYEELRRGMARIQRSGGPLSLVRLVLTPSSDCESADTSKLKCSDDDILRFADVLKRSSRGEDLCARMGEMEFIVLLFVPQSVAEIYIQRVSREWSASFFVRNDDGNNVTVKFIASCLTSLSGPSALELLHVLDYKPLTTCGE